ncbi:threonine synthase [bacterium BMS3Abin04]|nr:threonine synthase [bacterium BMS3Abin04]
MQYYSTNNHSYFVNFRTAILEGLAKDKGLFLPEKINTLSKDFIGNLQNYSFQEISFNIAKYFVGDEIEEADLLTIINKAISFEAPVKVLSDNLSILELFHGPTLAFKDFGARFLAGTMEYFLKNESKEITILVATSGDTGSAVANGFLNIDGINVVVLFPEGKISKIQEKQITTLGNNITAIEIEGTFDDCQRLVKSAFMDDELKLHINLSSANSINIGRLIPQTFYYFESFKQIENILKDKNIIYSVPSGNLGNLTAGLFAKKMGLPINKFIAANNNNDVFTDYIDNGIFKPKPSKETLSNAMDVGNPSNFVRIVDVFNNNHSKIKDVIYSKSYSDSETVEKINELYEKFGYIIDPHGAVGCLALDTYQNYETTESIGVVLETAHPAKFGDIFQKHLDITPDIPERLALSLSKEGNAVKLSGTYDEFKKYLLS